MPSSSSESDEDCYGNVARKLQSLKNNFRINITQNERKFREDRWSPLAIEADNSLAEDSFILDDLPPVLPQATKPATSTSGSSNKRVTRRSARLSKDNSLPSDLSLSPSGRKSVVTPTPVPATSATESAVADVAVSPAVALQPTRRGRKRIAARRAAETSAATSALSVVAPVSVCSPAVGTPGRGRGRGRGRSRPSRSRAASSWHIETVISTIGPTTSPTVYSIGNTHEYPDTVENIPLFSQKPAAINDPDVGVADDLDLSSSFVEDNEELSVKVYWQQTEFVKFNIRRFQKLVQIFEFFSKREAVSADKLLFTLRGSILRPEDTPDSIQYNIGLFIGTWIQFYDNGGVVNCSTANLGVSRNTECSGGIKIKFQCQNAKRPYETTLQPDQKLSLAMVKCAEHFELPYDKLKFLLDGDTISSSGTAVELGLEDGECIDVKLLQ